MLILLFLGVGAALVAVLPDLTASYNHYNSAADITARARIGERIITPLNVTLPGPEYRYEGDRRGLVVESPPEGFQSGWHVYYLQIVSSEPRLSEAGIFGTTRETKEFLVARVVRVT